MNQKELCLAIFSPNRSAVSETFIKAHIDNLPFIVSPQYGDQLSIENSSGKKIWFWGFWFDAFASRAMPKVHRLVRTFFLARHLRRIKADAVLAEYGPTGGYLAPACGKAKIPLFVHFHGFDASVNDVLERNEQSYLNLFEYASGVVAVSQAMRERLISLGAKPSRLIVTACGVDPEKFPGSSPAVSSPDFLAVGRFVEKKAPYLTLLAFSRVIKAVPEASLTIVGTGPLFGPCKRLIEALHLERSVKLLGVRGPDEVSRYMSKARAFVQHSLVAENGDSEGTPVAVIEAQMSGLPVVSTRHAGIPDVVIDGETGFIVEEADVDGMADAMIKLARDSLMAAKMGAAARKRALEHFTLQRHIDQLADMIREGVKFYQSKGA